MERHPFLPLLFARPEPALVVVDTTFGTRSHHFGKALRGFAGSKFRYEGGTRNTEVIGAADEAQALRWNFRRRLVYRGSFAHFFRALLHRRLAREGFEVLNPESFVGLYRSGESFVLVAWPELRVRVPGGKAPQSITLRHGWLRVSPDGRIIRVDHRPSDGLDLPDPDDRQPFGWPALFDVTRDGQLFLVTEVVPDKNADPTIAVVPNWSPSLD